MMYCRSCGRQTFVAAKFCADCGAPARAPEQVRPFQDDSDETTQVSESRDYTTQIIPPRITADLPPPVRDRGANVLPYAMGAALGIILLLGGILALLLTTDVLNHPSASPPKAASAPSAPPQERAPDVVSSAVTPAPRPTQASTYTPPAAPRPTQDAPSSPPPSQMPPRTIAQGPFYLRAGQFISFPFEVPSGSLGIVEGSYTVAGGSNDAEVLIMPSSEVYNYQRRQSFLCSYRTGYVTGHPLRAQVPSGQYVLVISNLESILTDKRGGTNFTIRYK